MIRLTLAIGACAVLGACQTYDPWALPEPPDVEVTLSPERIRQERFEAQQISNMPQIGRVGMIDWVEVAPGLFGYSRLCRHRQLGIAGDFTGMDQMRDFGQIVMLESCKFRVIDMDRYVSGYAPVDVMCEIRIEDGPLAGKSAWMHFGWYERSKVQWSK